MKENVYEYFDYKEFINDQIESLSGGVRGMRKKLAEAMNCQVSYVTTVLNGTAHFSFEQTAGCCRFFNLNEAEAEFLILLVQFARAGSEPLKEILSKQIEKSRENQLRLKNRLKMKSSISLEHQIEHYSSWDYAAVHVLLSIPKFQTVEKLANKLGLSTNRVDRILRLLVGSGLAEKKAGKYKISDSQIHLGSDSHLIARHHTNWRLRNIKEFEEPSAESLHYSGAVTLSEDDFKVVKSILSRALTRSFKVIKSSKEECGSVLCLDWYKL